MKNNQVKETKQKKSFKEVVVENKGKILIGTGIIVSAVAAYFIGTKIKTENKNINVSNIQDEINDVVMDGVSITGQLANLNAKRMDTVEKILIEGGVLEQAEATITRKKDRLISKRNCLLGTQMNPDKDRIIEELESGIETFNKMLEGCDFIRFCWKDDTIEKLLKED